MTLTLAIDTSTRSQVLALLDGQTVLARRMFRVPRNHSETLLRNVADTLSQAGKERQELDLVAVGLGPGTFTGLRVGLATAKALAVGVRADLVGVSSLAATARPVSALFEGTVFALCDARRGEVYCEAFDASAQRFESIGPPRAMRPEDVIEDVLATNGPVVLIGNGLRRYEELRAIARDDLTVLGQPWDGPSSVSVGLLGQAKLRDEGPDDVEALEPNYVRPSDAEVNVGPPETTRSEMK